MSISTVTPVANNSGAAALSAAGIGSGLDVNSIVSKLMQVESLPLTQLNSQVSSYQATLSAYGTVNSALSTFQSSVTSLNSPSMFGSLSVTPVNSSILTGSTTSTAITGSYNVNVTQLAQAQSLATAGQASTSSAISSGAGSDNFIGSTLSSSVATEGIATGSLTLNGTAIATDSSTTSATALAAQINLATGATGVTASVTQPSSTGKVTFVPVSTGSGDSYSLQVGNTVIASIGANSQLSAAQLDSALQTTGFGSVGAALAADGVSFTGTAEAGTLQFTKADGSNLAISQTLTNTSGNSSGGITGLNNSGTAQTYLGGVTLTSSSPITVGGSAPSAAGLGSTITFQFGNISADLVGSSSVDYSSGIAAGSLTLNGTAIATDSSTTSAATLAKQINYATGATGVTATVSGSGAVTLTSANPITVAGSNPTLAGFTAGSTLSNGAYN
ncbi:MAG: flagellar cap protein FliD N-terminal domain-containing protein, partial [Burkholderiales bacterium]